MKRNGKVVLAAATTSLVSLVLTGTALAGVATPDNVGTAQYSGTGAQAAAPAPDPDNQLRESDRQDLVVVKDGRLAVPSAGAVVSRQDSVDGTSRTTYADGSVLATSPGTFFSNAQVSRGALRKLDEGKSLEQVQLETQDPPPVQRDKTSPPMRTDQIGSVRLNSCGSVYMLLINGNKGGGRGYQYDTGFLDTCRKTGHQATNFKWTVTVNGQCGWRKTDSDAGFPINTFDFRRQNNWRTPCAGNYIAYVVQPSTVTTVLGVVIFQNKVSNGITVT